MDNNEKTIDKVIKYIEDNLNNQLSLDDIAKYANYSKFHLNRMFLDVIGCTIHQYVQKRRLTEAAKSLVYTDKSIIEIAYDAGYETQQSFTLAFKNIYNKSPQVYRRESNYWPIEAPYSNYKYKSNYIEGVMAA